MAFVKGSAFRFYSNTGTIATPAYTALSCEGDVTISISNDLADTSSKCSDWNTNEIVKSGWSVSGSGMYSDGDAGVDEIVDAIIARTKLMIQVKTVDAKTFSGSVSIDSFDFSASHDGVVEFSFSATGDSTLTFA